MMDTHIIVWVNEKNEYQGKGLSPMPKDVAERVCKEFNERYPEITHKAIEVKTAVND
jgi:hypothetical protein